MRRGYWTAISILGGIVLLLALCLPRREPSYQNKSLSAWLRGFESEKVEARWQAAEAMRHFGACALPFLTERLRHPDRRKEPSWKAKVRELLSKLTIFNSKIARPVN